MYISMNISGVRQQVFLVEEELKKLNSLKSDIYQKYQFAVLSSDDRIIHVCRRCWDMLAELERSFRWRSEFLENLADEFQKISSEVDAELDEALELLKSVDGEDLQRR